jgi:hypothetical protein
VLKPCYTVPHNEIFPFAALTPILKYQGYNQMFWSSLNAQIKEIEPEEVGKVSYSISFLLSCTSGKYFVK